MCISHVQDREESSDGPVFISIKRPAIKKRGVALQKKKRALFRTETESSDVKKNKAEAGYVHQNSPDH